MVPSMVSLRNDSETDTRLGGGEKYRRITYMRVSNEEMMITDEDLEFLRNGARCRDLVKRRAKVAELEDPSCA